MELRGTKLALQSPELIVWIGQSIPGNHGCSAAHTFSAGAWAHGMGPVDVSGGVSGPSQFGEHVSLHAVFNRV